MVYSMIIVVQPVEFSTIAQLTYCFYSSSSILPSSSFSMDTKTSSEMAPPLPVTFAWKIFWAKSMCRRKQSCGHYYVVFSPLTMHLSGKKATLGPALEYSFIIVPSAVGSTRT